jgi:hypothetical protein
VSENGAVGCPGEAPKELPVVLAIFMPAKASPREFTMAAFSSSVALLLLLATLPSVESGGLIVVY